MSEEILNSAETENQAVADSAAESTQDTAPAENAPADTATETAQESPAAAEGDDSSEKGEEPAGAEKIADAIDKLGIAADAEKKPEEKPAEEQPTDAPKAEGAATKPEEQKPAAEQKKPDEQADEELLKGVSERGRDRLRKLLSEGRESAKTLGAIQHTIAESGLDKESFGNLLSISRLVSSQDPTDVEQGLTMLEQVRTALYKTLGRDLPGTDPLQHYEDLRKKVDGMEMSRDDAVLIAQARRRDAAEKASRAAAEQERRAAAEMSGRVEAAKAAAMARINRHAGEADFDMKLNRITAYFQQPGRLQEFVRTHAPETWGEALEFMYASLQGAPAPRDEGPGPITSGRARAAGHRVTSMQGSADSIAARIRDLGI